ncbi:amidohydrolase family protein [Nonomuraea sp. NN258]|uniref:amidohydrolase family protein n=1 Tax=Nonomuraea antri TaxID=2730852 RepID=UPI0015696EEF|nr:amidohydrolase family protein [Nonomuraea antri]NRQ38835.1 amidohydrolase family protein [Nonomuraea antri]
MSSRREFLRTISLTGAAAAAGAGAFAAPARAASSEPDGQAASTGDGQVTVVRRGTLIDGTGAAPVHDATVVIAGDRILWAGDARGAAAYRGARVVDLRGKYVLPGLWDMHVHGSLAGTLTPPLLIANGVTGVREMWGNPALHALRARIDSGELLGPRMVIASNIIDGPISLLDPQPVAKVATEAEARQAVRAAKAEGADFLKVYSFLGRDAFAAIADEARRQGLPVGGHLPYLVTPQEAVAAGQRSFEHLLGLTLATSTREGEFRRQMASTPIDPAEPRRWYGMVREFERLAAESYDHAKARALFELFVRNDVRQSPTLKVLRVLSQPADTYAHDPRLKYVPRLYREFWAEAIKASAPSTPEQIRRQRRLFQSLSWLVGEMYRAGVPLIGGTDCLNPYVIPGFSVHDELALLVAAGLPPMAALRTMTRDAARHLGREATMGTVTAGKVADLLVVDADPLADIGNTRRIHAIVTRGRLITRRRREQILAEVEAAAADPQAGTMPLVMPACACHRA